MAMITCMWAFAAVNHAGSSALLPMLLAPHNKYAIIYLHAAGGQEAWGKHPTVKPHTRTHTHTRILRFTLKNTHITCLLKGTINDPFLYICG